MSSFTAYYLMRRYSWTAAEVAALPDWLLPMLLAE